MALALSTFRRLPVRIRRLIVRTVAPTYVVGVVAVISNPAGELLLLRERHHDGWALPGGLLARGEAPAEALVRELGEEIGVEIPVGVLPEPRLGLDPKAHRVDVIYELPNFTHEPTAKEPEVLEASWFSRDELPELFEPTLAVLRTAHFAPTRAEH